MKILSITYCLIVFLLSISCNSYKNSRIVKSKTTLNNVWVLQSLNSNTYDRSSLKHPLLEININEEKFYGNDGCNQIMGSIKEVTNKTIEFTNIAGTRMRCLNMESSNHYLSLLQKTRRFKIQNSKLTLLDSDKNILMSFSN